MDVTYLLEGAALGADAAMPSTERISAQESADLAAHPDGIATANRVATRGGVLPTGVTTRVTTRVVPAPQHASFAARVSVTYANEAEIHALIQRARLAHGESRGPPLRAAAGFNSEAADSRLGLALGHVRGVLLPPPTPRFAATRRVSPRGTSGASPRCSACARATYRPRYATGPSRTSRAASWNSSVKPEWSSLGR